MNNQQAQLPISQQQPPAVPSSNASQGSASRGSSNRNNGPTISIENVELLEADRQHDEKRSRRPSRQQEAAAAAAAAAVEAGAARPNGTAPAPNTTYGTNGYAANGGAYEQPPPSAYGAPPGQQSQDPNAPSNYFYPNYVPAPAPGQQQPPHGLASRQEPHYGMAYQGGYQTAGSGFYSPPASGQAAGNGGYGGNFFPPGQGQQPGVSPPSGAQANEYTNILGQANNTFGDNTGYGSLGGNNSATGVPPQQQAYRLSPPANHTDVTGSSNRGMGALTIDDIEKTFNAVVNQQVSVENAARPPAPSSSTGADPSANPAIPTNNNLGSSNNSLNNSASKLNSTAERRGSKGHRRSNSNASASSQKAHRRSGSTGNLPPVGPGRSPAPSSNNRKKPDTTRRRSLSGTFGSNSSTGGVPRRGSFPRTHSNSDLASVGAQSVTSHHSIVSDISKSALFQGVTDEGHVQLHFPYEAVRLINNVNMERGRLYMQEIHAHEYDNYHVAAEEANGWEHRLDNDNRFKNLDELLPRNYYALRVDDDLYRRVLDEIAESHSMPCGMFFCGHHEDVSYPSIRIAMVAVAIIFGTMGYVAFVFQV